MGLLSRASDATSRLSRREGGSGSLLGKTAALSASNDFERSCIERLRRLEHGGGSAYAALTVLRAYFPAGAELIYRKKEAAFRVVETAGIEEKSCAPSRTELPALTSNPLPPEGYYTLPAAELGPDCVRQGSEAYAFPLPGATAYPLAFLVVVAKDEDAANLASIRRILDACPKIFLGDPRVPALSGAPASGPTATEESAANDGMRSIGKAQIVVFRLGRHDARLVASMAELAQSRLGALGTSFALGPDRLTVFLKDSLDRELYSHLLLKTFRKDLSLEAGDLAVAAEGRAENPAEALAIIRSPR